MLHFSPSALFVHSPCEKVSVFLWVSRSATNVYWYILQAIKPWQTRTHCCSRGFLGYANWERLLRTQNVSEQHQKHFLCPGHKTAINVAHAGKQGNVCVGNNVSSFARAYRSFQLGRFVFQFQITWYSVENSIFFYLQNVSFINTRQFEDLKTREMGQTNRQNV